MIYCLDKIKKISFCTIFFLFVVAVYSPLLISSKPVFVIWNKTAFFPLFRYLLCTQFYTHPIDIFFNILMITLPCSLVCMLLLPKSYNYVAICFLSILQIVIFTLAMSGYIKNPEEDYNLRLIRQQRLHIKVYTHNDSDLNSSITMMNWDTEVQYMSQYEKLNTILLYKKYSQSKCGKKTKNLITKLKSTMDRMRADYEQECKKLPILMFEYIPLFYESIVTKYEIKQSQVKQSTTLQTKNNDSVDDPEVKRLSLLLSKNFIEKYRKTANYLCYLKDKEKWLAKEGPHLTVVMQPLLSNFHWEELNDNHNRLINFFFGIRNFFAVGVATALLSTLVGFFLLKFSRTLLITTPFIDICKIIPSIFIILFLSVMTQNRSIYLIIIILGIKNGFNYSNELTDFSKKFVSTTLKATFFETTLSAMGLIESSYPSFGKALRAGLNPCTTIGIFAVFLPLLFLFVVLHANKLKKKPFL